MINVIKRDNTVTEFDTEKIKIAITKAMSETVEGIDKDLAGNISDEIFSIAKTKSLPVTVEDIQDIVEELLMDTDRKDVARQYIIYRHERSKTRKGNRQYGHLLSDKFISKYKHLPNPMDQLGNFVYYRTYSRWLEKEGRREYWWETVRRAVEYNCRLAKTSVQEAEELFDNIFNLRQFLSGRTFWVGGTKVAYEYPSANYNCFKSDTEFLTKYGIANFKQFRDGDVVDVLDGNGAWTPSLIRNYGKERLYKLTVRKNSTKYTEDIYVTGNHHWFVDKYNDGHYIEKQTIGLKKGDSLRYKKRYESTNLNIDPMSIIHGIIYGDGTYNKEKNHCQIRLCGDKVKLLEYLKGYPYCNIKGTDDIFVYGLPYNFKKLPYTYSNPEYLKGFVYGIMLTDGSFDGSIRLRLSEYYSIQAIQSYCEIIGITTSKIKERFRSNNNFNSTNQYMYEMTLHKDSFYKHFPQLLESVTNIQQTKWVVESVELTDLIEDVWCCEVPTTQSFTLRGGIHTHNCAFTVSDKFQAFIDLFYLLMVGAGVGIRILKEDIEKLPKIRTNISLFHKEYDPVNKDERLDQTSLKFISNDTVEIIIGDSKSGWVQGLAHYLEMLYNNDYKNITNVIMNYNMVRPKGEALKTFGGTASGHESLKNMFVKIDKVISRKQSEGTLKVKLKTIDCMDIANIIGENVVVGGVRRTSEIMLIDPDDEECINAKSSLYTQDKNGEWIVNKDLLHRSMSNNSIYYQSKPTREKLHWQFDKMRYSGEPGWVNAEAGVKRRNNMNGVNPCFTGDMRILTMQGYIPFNILNGYDVALINKDGNMSMGKVWCSGEKEVYEIKFANRPSITCTKDHPFMDIDSNRVEAIDLKGRRIMPYLNHNLSLIDNNFVQYGFLQGDGNLGRLVSPEHKGLEINLGQKDEDVRDLFQLDGYEGRKLYINGYNNKLRELGFSSNQLPERTLPNTIDQWNYIQLRSFIKGLFSANGSVLSCGRIQFKSTCKELIDKLQNLLHIGFGIESYITTNPSKENEFLNGTYTMKESYDLCIQQYQSRINFYNEIGFIQDYKMNILKSTLIEQAPKVINVINTGRVEKVYDFSEPDTHWGVVEGVIAHNCGEILLDSEGLCNLTTLNVYAFVVDGKLDVNRLKRAQRNSTRSGLRMTQVELELPAWNNVQKRDHLIGCSLTGWQDMVNATGMSKDDEIELLKQLKLEVHLAAEEYCEELGISVPVCMTTVKPEGTLSQLPGVSSGVHYSHSPYFVRRVRVNSNDPLVKVCEDLEYPIFPEVGQSIENCNTKVIEFPCKAPVGRTKYDVSAIEQLENYKMFMEHYVEHNVSITVHVRENEWEAVEQWVWDNWDLTVALTFLSLDDSFYKLMPYEAITEEDYNQRVSQMKPFVPSLLQKYEKREQELDIGNDGCESGICPIR